MKKIATTLIAALLTATAAIAQDKPAPTPKPSTNAPAQKAAPEPAPLPVNIKIEVSITDQTSANPPAKKVVTMIASDRENANVRSSANVVVRQGVMGPMTPGGVPTPASYMTRTVTINVDARPVIVAKEPNKIAMSFGLEYLPKPGSIEEQAEPGMTTWSERLGLILESGKPMVISQAADPTSDRKITVEVTATILK
jgi:hypothetical protein